MLQERIEPAWIDAFETVLETLRTCSCGRHGGHSR